MEIIIQAPDAYIRHTLEPSPDQADATPTRDAEPSAKPKRKQLAVDALVRALSMLPSSARRKPVWLMRETALPLMSWGSYRGYYECIALEPARCTTAFAFTVDSLIDSLRGRVGKTMSGYKGGEYPIEWSTRLYVSPHGEASGLMAVGVSEVNSYVLIETQSEDD